MYPSNPTSSWSGICILRIVHNTYYICTNMAIIIYWTDCLSVRVKRAAGPIGLYCKIELVVLQVSPWKIIHSGFLWCSNKKYLGKLDTIGKLLFHSFKWCSSFFMCVSFVLKNIVLKEMNSVWRRAKPPILVPKDVMPIKLNMIILLDSLNHVQVESLREI